jgi:hypothetical protein
MSSSSKKVIYAALMGNRLISITKFIAVFYSGSSAILSEGRGHSLVDTGNIDLQIKQNCPRVNLKRVFIEAEVWSTLTAEHQNN